MGINLNQIVYFKLTDHGKRVWYRKREAWRRTLPAHIADELLARRSNPPTSMQLWEFMREFGPEMYPGNVGIVVDCEISLGHPLEQLAEAADDV